MNKTYKRPEKQHTVGAILLGTLAASVITLIKMPEVIDTIVSKVYGPTINIKPDEWEETSCEEADTVACDAAEEVEDEAVAEAEAKADATDEAPAEPAQDEVIPEEE